MSYPYTGCGGKYKVPLSVKKEAEIGLLLRKNGFEGGTSTGWGRGKQLKECEYVSKHTIKIMKAWFARHGPRAKNGGTSYPGYKKWVKNGKPKTPSSPPNSNKNDYRGAVSWLIWGGDEGLKWVDSINLD